MKSLLRLVLALAIIAVGNAAWAGSWSGSTGDQFISMPGNSAIYAPTMAAGPQGQLYAAWAQRVTVSDYEVFFSRSTDGGINWSGTASDTRISPFDNVTLYIGGIFGYRRIDMAVDSEGRIFVFWPEYYKQADLDSSIEIIFVYSTDGGDSWEHSDLNYPVSDTLSPAIANYPACAIDHNDNIHVVWNQIDPATTKADVFYSRSTDHGLTWSGRFAERAISFPDSDGWHPDIAVGPDNRIHVIWKEKDIDSKWKINYGVSANGGTSFSSEIGDSVISIGHTSNSNGSPRLAVSDSGYIHAMYCIGDTVHYVGTADGGASWTNNVPFIGVGYDFYAGDIGVTSQGQVIIVINEEYPSRPEAFGIYALYSLDNGASWSATRDPVSYNDGGLYDRSYIPTIAITAGDTLHVVYYTNTLSTSNSNQEMAYSRSDTFAIAVATEGLIMGTVKEQNGITPISDVIVEARDIGSILVGTDTTDVAGSYQFTLPGGIYSNDFSKAGYRDTTLPGIILLAGDTSQVAMIMYATGPGPCQYLQGDINGDGLRGGGDVTYGVRFFKLIGNRPPDSCYMDSTGGYLYVAGDVNGNCEFRGSDISRLVAYFKLLIGLSYCHFFPPPPGLLLKNELIGKTPVSEK